MNEPAGQPVGFSSVVSGPLVQPPKGRDGSSAATGAANAKRRTAATAIAQSFLFIPRSPFYRDAILARPCQGAGVWSGKRKTLDAISPNTAPSGAMAASLIHGNPAP